MENFLLAAAGVVGQAVAQEAISRTVSSVLGKRKEKASQGDYMERLETAVRYMQSVLERTAKAPITEVSLLRDRNHRIELERGYMEAKAVLNKHKKRQRQAHGDQQQQEITQAITTHSSSGSPQGTSVARRAIFSIASSFISPMEAEPSHLSCDDMERFERTHKSFNLKLNLRLSESTDIVQVAIKSLQSLVAKFKLGLLEPATGALLQLASSQDIVSHAPRWRDPQWASFEEKYMEITQLCRPNAVCCTPAYGYDEEPCAKESRIFPEEIISLGVTCFISGLELTLPSPSDITGETVFGDQPPQLCLSGLFIPHHMTHVMTNADLRKTVDSMLECQKEGVAFDIIATQYSEHIECSIQEAAEKAIEGLFRMDLEEFRKTAFLEYICFDSEEGFSMHYRVSWFSKHGAAFFKVHDAARYALFERGGLWPDGR